MLEFRVVKSSLLLAQTPILWPSGAPEAEAPVEAPLVEVLALSGHVGPRQTKQTMPRVGGGGSSHQRRLWWFVDLPGALGSSDQAYVRFFQGDFWEVTGKIVSRGLREAGTGRSQSQGPEAISRKASPFRSDTHTIWRNLGTQAPFPHLFPCRSARP